jgi:hypothetical protein
MDIDTSKFEGHTGGGWNAQFTDDGVAGWIAGPDANVNVICDLVPRTVNLLDAEDVANAELIAAAPALLSENARLRAELEGYQEAETDHNRLVRELDVILSGEENTAKQASLCDLVALAGTIRDELAALRAPANVQAAIDAADYFVNASYQSEYTDHDDIVRHEGTIRSTLLSLSAGPSPEALEALKRVAGHIQKCSDPECLVCAQNKADLATIRRELGMEGKDADQ